MLHPLRSLRLRAQYIVLALLFALPATLSACSGAHSARPASSKSQTADAASPGNVRDTTRTQAIPTSDSVQMIEGARDRVRANPRDESARLALADALARSGDPVGAANELREAARLMPRDAEPHRRLAQLYLSASYVDRAAEELEKAVSLAPSDWRSSLDLAQIYLGVVWLDRADAALTQAERSAPNDPGVILARTDYWYRRRNTAKMEQAARDGLRRHPDDARLLLALAQALRLQRRFAEAEQVQRQQIAASRDPKLQAQGYNALANLLITGTWPRPRLSEAEQAARLALAKNPDSSEAHYWLGRALDLEGRAAEAATHYAITAASDIEFESIAYDLGRLYLRSPDPSTRKQGERLLSLYHSAEVNGRAFADARALVRDHPERPEAHRQAALWYIKGRQYPKAVLELRRTLQLDPRDREARRLLASALSASGRNTEARSYAS